jgi:hypothetical protein
MSTQPPAPPPPAAPPPYYGPSPSGMPPLAIPNMEFVVFVVALLALGIITAVADSVAWSQFVSIGGWITAAYLISRGLAKMGRASDTP